MNNTPYSNPNSLNYEETNPQGSQFNHVSRQPSIETLSQQAQEAYPQHAVSSYNVDPAYRSDVDASRSATYSHFEVEQPRKLTLAEMTNNIIAVRAARLKAESSPSPVRQSQYDLAA